MDDWMTLKEAAAYAGYTSTSTLKAAAAAGKLTTERPAPNLHLTKREWVDAYLATIRVPGRGARGKGRPRRQPPEAP